MPRQNALPSGTKRARFDSDDQSEEDIKGSELVGKDGSVAEDEDEDASPSLIEGDENKTFIQIQEDILLQNTVANVHQNITVNKLTEGFVNL